MAETLPPPPPEAFAAPGLPAPPPAAFAARPAGPARPADAHGPVVGGALDVVGLTDRPGARTIKDVLLAPQGLAEHLAQGAVIAPLIALGGEAVGVAGIPVSMGRIAASGAVGGMSSLFRHDDVKDVLWNTVIDTALGAIGEGGLHAALRAHLRVPFTGIDVPIGPEKIAGPLTRAKAGYEFYTKQIDRAIETVRKRLPKGRWITAPEIDASRKITVDEALSGLKRLEGHPYKIAREQLKHELNRLDMMRIIGPKPYAGSIVKATTPKERFRYAGTPLMRLAERIGSVGRAPLTAGAVDAALVGSPETQDVLAGVGAGALEAPGSLLRVLHSVR